MIIILDIIIPIIINKIFGWIENFNNIGIIINGIKQNNINQLLSIDPFNKFTRANNWPNGKNM